MSASDRDEALKELGRLAQEKRLNAQLSLEEIYERTRIRLEFLQGIEQGNYKGFPDLVYTKGFVRTYLSVLKADDLKDDFMSCLNQDGALKEKNLPTNILGNGTSPTKGFKPVSHLWLFAILILTLAGAGGYAWYSRDDILSLLRAGGTGAADPIGRSDISSDERPFVAISPDSPSWLGLESLDISSPEIAPEPEPIEPHLLIRIVGEVWMRVTIGERVVLERTLQPGDEVSWDLPARARVRYGRINAAEVVLNGNELGAVRGQGRGSRAVEYDYNPDGTHQQVR